MSTTIPQEQNPLQTDDHHTNFVKAEKSASHENQAVEQENLVSENPKKDHQEPNKHNEQIPDQSGTSLTENANTDKQQEKLPEPNPHKENENLNSEPPKKTEQDSSIQKHPSENPVPSIKNDNIHADVHVNTEKMENTQTNQNQIPSSDHHDSNLLEKQPDQSHSHTPQNEEVHKEEKQPEVKKVEKQPEIKKEEKQHEVKKEEKQSEVKKEEKQPEIKKEEKQPEVNKEEKQPEIKKVEKLPETKKEEKQSEIKKEEKQPEKQKEEKQPEIKKVEKLPEIKKEEKQPEVKKEEKQPEIKKEEKQPEVNKEEKQHEVKKEEKQPEIKKEEKQSEVKKEEKQSEIKKEDKQPEVKKDDKSIIEQAETEQEILKHNDKNEEEFEQELKSHPQTHPTQEKTENSPQAEIIEQIGSIFNFFSVTKDNIIQSSQPAIDKLGELVSKSNIVAIIQGNEYKPVITSDHITQQKSDPIPSSRRRKSIQTEQTKVNNTIQTIKSPKKTTITTATKTGVVDSQTLLGSDKSLPKLKVRQPDAKNRNEIEEQIRQHKIQEIIKQKNALEMKLSALNDQLTDLQKIEYSNSPNRSKSKPKETREEFVAKKKKAVEFAKKMLQEQKAIEVRTDQRREARQVLVNKEIETLKQLAEKKYERKKVMDYIRGQSEAQKKEILKAKYGMASLEEKKLELKNKREFDKDLDTDFANPKDPLEHDQQKLTSKSSKQLYKSPMLPQVLAHDADQKKVESEKIAKRKALHDKQVEYGRGVKDVFLPKVQSKFEARKLKMGVYKSQQVDTYLLRAGKDGLYGYLDKMKNELEVNPMKLKKKPVKHRPEPRSPQNEETEFENEEYLNANVNVAYGKELVYELQDNWNLADGTMSNRMSRNPDITSKTPKKHHKKDFDGNQDSDFNTEENTYRSSKRATQNDDEEDL